VFGEFKRRELYRTKVDGSLVQQTQGTYHIQTDEGSRGAPYLVAYSSPIWSHKRSATHTTASRLGCRADFAVTSAIPASVDNMKEEGV
jgi:hypothetical protein